MTKVIVRVHPFHLMNADWAPGGHQPSDQANWLGLWVRQSWQLPSTSTIAIVIITQFTVPQRVEGWVDLGTPVKVHSPCPRQYITAAVAINTTVYSDSVIWTLVLSLGSQVVSVLDSGTEGPGFKSQSRRCRITVLGKLFTPTVPLFTMHRNL